MIIYINDRLYQWADWCSRGRPVRMLGHPSRASFLLGQPSDMSLREPVPDEDCWEIERAVHRLDPLLRAVVDQFYRRAGTAETHAKALRCCTKTMYTRLHMAHVSIMDWLHSGEDENKRLTGLQGFGRKHIS